jgi:hypothetical protein
MLAELRASHSKALCHRVSVSDLGLGLGLAREGRPGQRREGIQDQ